jgi:tetratricopeptide (TPR) repeat protein
VATTQPGVAVAQSPTTTMSSDPAENAKLLTARGESDFKAGDFKGATYAWKHAVVDDPKNPVLVMMLSQAFFATGKYEEAAGATQMAMQMLPKDQWGVVVSNYKELYGNTQSYTDQLRALEKEVRDKPESPALRFLLGFQYAYLGFPKESIDQLDKGLKIAPQDEGAKQLRQEIQAKLPKDTAPAAPAAKPPAPSALIFPRRMAPGRMATARMAA